MFSSNEKFESSISKMLEQLNKNYKDLILNPNRVRDLYKKQPFSDENVLFRIHERELQSEFLTIWPIVLDPVQLKRMTRLLAHYVQLLRKDLPFNRIVSCSPTMRYLLEELSSQLGGVDMPVSFDYLGLHPIQASRRLAQYSSSDLVLIISDVVATGNMINEMKSTVQLSGGQVVGSISVFKTTYHDSISKFERFRNGNVASNSEDHLALFEARLKKAAKPGLNVKEITVDRTTVYPSLGERDENFEPLISESELLSRVSEKTKPATVMKFGTFTNRDKWISINFDIDGILKRCKPTLEKNLKKLIKMNLGEVGKSKKANKMRKLHIVTTPGFDNRTFISFIDKALKDNYRLRVTYIPRSETLSEQYSYFVPRSLEIPDGETVFLCLASVNTSEKLRALSAYLAMSGLRKIFVLTLLNRMNFAAGSFLSRVVNLRTGNDRGTHLIFDDPMQPSDFRYSTMFQVFDLTTQDMLRASEFAKDAIDHFQTSSVGGSFRLQAENELKYFSPDHAPVARVPSRRSIDLSEFHDHQLSQNLKELGYSLKRVPEAIVYSICLRECIQNRNFEFVAPIFFTKTSKELRYCILRLLILNVALLNVSGFLKYIKHEILVFIRDLESRKRKFASRSAFMDGDPIDKAKFSRGYKHINDIVEQQIQAMISLAFLVRTEPNNLGDNFAQEVIEGMLKVDDEKGCIEVSFCSASNPTFLWAVSFLANALNLVGSLSLAARNFARTLREELYGRATRNGRQSLSDVFLNMEDDNGESDITTETSAWLNEFLAFFVRDGEVAMRMSYLAMMSSIAERLFSKDRVRHIGQYQKLLHFENELKKNSNTTKNSDSFYIYIEDDEKREATKLAASSCAHALSDLSRTADYIDHLLRRAETPDDWADYFISPPHSVSAFRSDLDEYLKIIQPIRISYQILRRDLERAEKVRSRIIRQIWNPNDDQFVRSELWRYLQVHTFKFSDILAEAQVQANDFLLLNYGLRDVWKGVHLNLSEGISDFVGFGDRSIVLTALENSLQNIRHQIEQDPKSAYHPNNFVSAYVEMNGEVNRPQLLVKVGTFGTSQFRDRPRGNRSTTWRTDQSRMRQFGGDIWYDPVNEPSPGVVASLKCAASPFGAIFPELYGEAD